MHTTRGVPDLLRAVGSTVTALVIRIFSRPKIASSSGRRPPGR